MSNEQTTSALNPVSPQAPSSSDTNTNLVVYHLADSRSQRVLWLLEELQVPYEVVKIDRTPPAQGGGAPSEWKKVHPAGRFPVLVDKLADRVIAESGTIIDYLLRKHDAENKFSPPSGDEDAWLTNHYFTTFSEGGIMPWVRMLRMVRNIPESPKVATFWTRPVVRYVMNLVQSAMIRPQFEVAAKVVADRLEMVESTAVEGENENENENETGHVRPRAATATAAATTTTTTTSGWLAGGSQPTAADFMQSYPFAAVDKFYDEPPPSLVRYQERICARPAWKRAVERGGPFGIDMG